MQGALFEVRNRSIILLNPGFYWGVGLVFCRADGDLYRSFGRWFGPGSIGRGRYRLRGKVGACLAVSLSSCRGNFCLSSLDMIKRGSAATLTTC